MVFCNEAYEILKALGDNGHNPYFNRWFSAIVKIIDGAGQVQAVTILILIDGFLQYCNAFVFDETNRSHNPYFNRTYSVIYEKFFKNCRKRNVTILILIDGFLQSTKNQDNYDDYISHNPYFNRWFSAII